MAEITHLDDSTFSSFIAKAEKPVLVDFWASWCGPCKRLSPEFEKAAEAESDIFEFAKIDVDACPRTAAACRIESVPTVAVFDQRALVAMVVGFRNAKQITGEAKSHLRGFYEEKGCCANGCGGCGKEVCDGDCDCENCAKKDYCPNRH